MWINVVSSSWFQTEPIKLRPLVAQWSQSLLPAVTCCGKKLNAQSTSLGSMVFNNYSRCACFAALSIWHPWCRSDMIQTSFLICNAMIVKIRRMWLHSKHPSASNRSVLNLSTVCQNLETNQIIYGLFLVLDRAFWVADRFEDLLKPLLFVPSTNQRSWHRDMATRAAFAGYGEPSGCRVLVRNPVVDLQHLEFEWGALFIFVFFNTGPKCWRLEISALAASFKPRRLPIRSRPWHVKPFVIVEYMNHIKYPLQSWLFPTSNGVPPMTNNANDQSSIVKLVSVINTRWWVSSNTNQLLGFGWKPISCFCGHQCGYVGSCDSQLFWNHNSFVACILAPDAKYTQPALVAPWIPVDFIQILAALTGWLDDACEESSRWSLHVRLIGMAGVYLRSCGFLNGWWNISACRFSVYYLWQRTAGSC